MCLIFLVLCPLYGSAATIDRATGSHGATSMFGMDGIRQAANAADSTMTWVPASGAPAFQTGHADQKVSYWASNTMPVYSSQKNASRISDIELHPSGGASVASVLTVPITAIGRALIAKTGGDQLMRRSNRLFKEKTSRNRPNGGEKVSFSSSHSAGTAPNSTLIYHNIEYLNLYSTATPVTQTSLVGMIAAIAGARVKSNQHYPSDVLVGAAIGHFFGVFITDALLAGPVPPSIITPEAADLERVGLLVSLHMPF